MAQGYENGKGSEKVYETSFEFELDEESKKKLDELKELELEMQETLESASRVVDKEELCYAKELY